MSYATNSTHGQIFDLSHLGGTKLLGGNNSLTREVAKVAGLLESRRSETFSRQFRPETSLAFRKTLNRSRSGGNSEFVQSVVTDELVISRKIPFSIVCWQVDGAGAIISRQYKFHFLAPGNERDPQRATRIGKLAKALWRVCNYEETNIRKRKIEREMMNESDSRRYESRNQGCRHLSEELQTADAWLLPVVVKSVHQDSQLLSWSVGLDGWRGSRAATFPRERTE